MRFPRLLERQRTYGHDEEDPTIADLTEAIQINPRNVQAIISRGRAYTARGDFDYAIADFNLAISLDPSKGDVIWGAVTLTGGRVISIVPSPTISW